jgi:pyrroline-5-carboxylate reductase
MKVSFIGGGVMAEAIIGGMLKARLAAPDEIRVGEPVESRRSYLADRYGLDVVARNADAVDGSEMLVLSVKPQNLTEVLADLRPASNRSTRSYR